MFLKILVTKPIAQEMSDKGHHCGTVISSRKMKVTTQKSGRKGDTPFPEL